MRGGVPKYLYKVSFQIDGEFHYMYQSSGYTHSSERVFYPCLGFQTKRFEARKIKYLFSSYSSKKAIARKKLYLKVDRLSYETHKGVRKWIKDHSTPEYRDLLNTRLQNRVGVHFWLSNIRQVF